MQRTVRSLSTGNAVPAKLQPGRETCRLRVFAAGAMRKWQRPGCVLQGSKSTVSEMRVSGWEKFAKRI